MRVKALRTFNISYNGELYNAYDGEIKHWDSDVVDYILNNFDDYIKLVDQKYNEFRGESTDKKPQIAPKYSLYLELDTGDFYYFKQQASLKEITINRLEQTQFTSSPDDPYMDQIDCDFFDDNVIYVVWDGVTYECNADYETGFPVAYGDSTYTNIPFYMFFQNDNIQYIDIYFDNTVVGMSHTIEIYVKEKEEIEAEWEKVGYRDGARVGTAVVGVDVVAKEE